MKKEDPEVIVDRLLLREAASVLVLKKANAAQRLHRNRVNLLKKLNEICHKDDTKTIVSIERKIVENDLKHYSNSQSMTNSLNAALRELTVIERHLAIVEDKVRYKAVDEDYSLPKSRKAGLPFDEGRKALASHYARLNNLDKSRLDDDEKQIIDARKTAIWKVNKIYTERQAKTLDVELVKKRGKKL